MKKQTQVTGHETRDTRRIILVSRVSCLMSFICLFGCYRQDMARQPSYHWPDQPSDFFPDGQANRPIEPGTVARGRLREDVARFTGQSEPTDDPTTEPKYVTAFPFPVDESMLRRGRERFNIFCSVCHGRGGDGDGRIVQRGYLKPPSYNTDLSRGYTRWKKDVSLRDVPVGYIFEVITKGYGGMPQYAGLIPVNDRWAIVAYVRALQFSRNVPADKLTDKDREELKAGGARGDR
jgi:mono/diheme cytochrome c family protein